MDQSVKPQEVRIIGNQKGMTTKQKAAIWLAILLVVVASLFPPWLPVRYVLDEAQRKQLDGVVLQLQQQGESEKTIQSAVEAFKRQFGSPKIYHWLFDHLPNETREERIDLSRLLVEWVTAVAIPFGLYFAWPTIALSTLKTFNWRRIMKPRSETIIKFVLIPTVGFAVLAFLIFQIWTGIQKREWLALGLVSVYFIYLFWKEFRKSGE